MSTLDKHIMSVLMCCVCVACFRLLARASPRRLPVLSCLRARPQPGPQPGRLAAQVGDAAWQRRWGPAGERNIELPCTTYAHSHTDITLTSNECYTIKLIELNRFERINSLWASTRIRPLRLAGWGGRNRSVVHIRVWNEGTTLTHHTTMQICISKHH